MANINYILPTNLTLSSSPPFNNNGLNLIYKLSNLSLNYILQDVNVTSLNSTDYVDMVNQNRRIFGYVAGLVAVTVLLLITGLCWCCRDCCRKADRRRKYDRKCSRNFWTLVYGSLVLGFTFLVISTTLTNEQLKSTIKDLPSQFNSSLSHASSYLNLTKTQVHTLFILNYGTLEASLLDTLSRAGDFIKNDLVDNLQIEHKFDKIRGFLNVTREARQILLDLFNDSKMIKTKTHQLEISLNQSKDRLLQIVESCNCGDQILEEFRKELGSDDEDGMSDFDLNKLPHLNATLTELTNILSADIESRLEQIQSDLQQRSIEFQSDVNLKLPNVRQQLNATKYELIHYNNLIARSIATVQEKLNNLASSAKDYQVEENLEYYEFMRYSSTLGTIGILVAILTCLIITACIGFCGKQPGSNIECCSRELGSSFVNCSTFLIIVTSALIAIMIAGYLALTGIVWLGCENSTASSFGIDDYIPKQIDIEGRHVNLPRIQEIQESCSEGKSAFTTLNLSTVYDIQGLADLPTRFAIPRVSVPDLNFHLPTFSLKLNSIQKINYTKVFHALDQPILSINLDQIIAQLTEIQSNTESEADTHSRLLNEIVFLNGMNSYIYRPLMSLVNKSLDGIRRIEELKGNLKVVEIEKLIQLDALSPSNLKTQLTGSINTFHTNCISQVQKYSNYTLDSILHKVGQCYPLYKIYKSNEDYVCVNMRLPFSGLWFCLNLIFLSYFPILMIGRVLKRLYRRGKKYGNRFDGSDSNNLGDSYSSDTIPLNTNNERKYRHTGRQASGSSRGPSTSRYDSDKAWSDHRAHPNVRHQPTHPASDEYERPPPYYYPGPAGPAQ